MESSSLATLATIASIFSMIASIIAGYVALYVKACIGPIATKVEVHEKRLDEQCEDIDTRIAQEGELWKEIHGVSRRVAHIEGGASSGKRQSSNH